MDQKVKIALNIAKTKHELSFLMKIQVILLWIMNTIEIQVILLWIMNAKLSQSKRIE